MDALRAFFRTHRRLALGVLVLAVLVKALVPAGYMLSDKNHLLTVAICSDASGQLTTKQIEVRASGQADHAGGDHAKAETTCAWGLLAMAALSGADVLLLALALAFILALGLLPSRPVLPSRGSYLRPPLRGPPAFT